ncbi:unnamed protein product [Fusarium venenatum]|uniref:Arrestin C-terminal-like domain-containing protein n=1 Tax=Fusarium venenatum TaxID=56646 RepID=A0A2L2SRS1_9HYPO|nr:uncharacterized protein FVRRES_13695 [Fusarium venenatum]CEI41689.1 unnamed protein product [Fusarium venenatum]
MTTLLGSGASCSVHLAEPSLFLPGFDCSYHDHPESQDGITLLRGTLRLILIKEIKIKSIHIKLVGHTCIKWEGQAGPDFCEEKDVQKQTSTIFDAIKHRDKDDFGLQCRYWVLDPPHTDVIRSAATRQTAILTSSEPIYHHYIDNKLPLAVNYSEIQRPSADNTISFTNETKHDKIFYPGIYEYDFVFPITHHQLETTQVPHATVNWTLFTKIARSGLFHHTLRGQKEVTFVRTPDPLSLEMIQPIPLRCHGDNWLQYDIVVSGRSFPIGSPIQIAMKVRPTEGNMVQGFELLINESIEYWFNNKKVNRKGPTRSILLVKTTAERVIIPTWTIAGQVSVHNSESEHELIHQNQDSALQHESIKTSGEVETTSSITETRENDLENIDANLATSVVLHVTQPDLSDPSGKRRIYRDTAISVPITILNCRSNQANMTLPTYSHDALHPVSCPTMCGCPDALPLTNEKPPRRFVRVMVARHLFNDRSKTPLTLKIGNNTATPLTPALINDEEPPRYNDVVDV